MGLVRVQESKTEVYAANLRYIDFDEDTQGFAGYMYICKGSELKNEDCQILKDLLKTHEIMIQF